MSKRNSGRRGRSRKRNRSASRPPEEAAAASGGSSRRRGARQPAGPRSGHRDPGGVGDRPEAPWHPWPLSELLIFVGAIGTIVAFATKGKPLLFASIGAVVLGTLDFTIREHRTGYRAHSSLLAAVPTAVMHGGIALALFAAGVRGEWLVVLPLLLDIPVFWLLFRLLRARFEDARRERVFALKSR